MAEKPTPPKIDDAPGLVWRAHKFCWSINWQARSDLVKRGYPITTWRILLKQFDDMPLSPDEIDHIRETCIRMQDEMRGWSLGIQNAPAQFDNTLATLINCYRTDTVSTYHKVRHHTRITYDSLLKRLDTDMGKMFIKDIKARNIHAFYTEWTSAGKVSMAHSLIAMLRITCSFGMAYLEDDECARLSAVLSKLRFKMGAARTERLTAPQVEAIREVAHAKGWHSIALANAFQFDCMLRQKDVIGEIVPFSEPIMTPVIIGNDKWARGLLWQEIDANLVLHHVTSKKQKPIHIPLFKAPMVVAELARVAGCAPEDLTRDKLPASGPVIIHDKKGHPWDAIAFRHTWRPIATAAGVPKHVRNMDSRAGGISEAVEAGASMEHIRHAATHSDMKTTARYDRGAENNVISVLDKRSEYRKRGENK